MENDTRTLSMCPGQFSPLTSTGMSSYLSKLIPVLVTPNNSLYNVTNATPGTLLPHSWAIATKDNYRML